MENNENLNNIQNASNEQKIVKKSNIVPSYMKKNEVKEENTKKAGIGKGKLRIKSKISLVIIFLTVLLIITLLVFGIYNIIKYCSTRKYAEYEDKMKIYGFDKMYDNGSAKSSEKVNQFELTKMVISASHNIYDITDVYTGNLTYNEISSGNLSEEKINQLWFGYGQELNFYNNIDNYEKFKNSNATLIDLIFYLSKSKTNILGKSLDVTSVPEFSDYDKYTNDEKIAIQDLAWNKILEANGEKLNGYKKLTKGQLNEIIIKFVEKYNLITLEGDKINISDEKMPANVNDFPYTLSSVKKEVYEIEFYNRESQNFILPVNLYSDMKEQYSHIKSTVEKYLEILYNVDYMTIDYNKMQRSLSRVILYSVDKSDLEQYIKYVKENEIIITATSKVILPVIYYDGMGYRVRAVVTYNVRNAKDLNNLIYYDFGSEYKLGETTVYFDILMQKEESGELLYIIPGDLKKNVSGNVYLSNF